MSVEVSSWSKDSDVGLKKRNYENREYSRFIWLIFSLFSEISFKIKLDYFLLQILLSGREESYGDYQ